MSSRNPKIENKELNSWLHSKAGLFTQFLGGSKYRLSLLPGFNALLMSVFVLSCLDINRQVFHTTETEKHPKTNSNRLVCECVTRPAFFNTIISNSGTLLRYITFSAMVAKNRTPPTLSAEEDLSTVCETTKNTASPTHS